MAASTQEEGDLLTFLVGSRADDEQDIHTYRRAMGGGSYAPRHPRRLMRMATFSEFPA